MVTASVIIATYNRAALLDECLEHLRDLRFEPGDEVLVVDNGSTDSTATVIERHARSFPAPLRRLEVLRPGKSHALAAAVEVATGDILAFTDDDINVAPEWLMALRDALADSTVALVGGPVAPRWEVRAPRWLAVSVATRPRLLSPLALLDYGPSGCDLGARTLLAANMAIRRDVMVQMGGFVTGLGKLRGTLLSGEDDDLCRRVQAAGFAASYIPLARVYHWVPRQRMRFHYCLAWFYWSGITHAALDDMVPSLGGRKILGVPAYLGRRLAAGLVGVSYAALRGKVNEAVERAVDIAFVAGYTAKQWRLVRGSPSQHAE